MTIARPAAEEHDAYYTKYIDRVPDGDLIQLLEAQMQDTIAVLSTVTPDREDFAYAPGKWTIKESIGHLSDTERIMAYRALRVARDDKTNLPSFDENLFVPAGEFGARTLSDLIDEMKAVRAATVQLAKHLSDDALARRGTASGKTITPRALLYIISGHERHHLALLRERYGVQ
ncbi:MAG: DinB family protein [Gemmatimonadaceae bacterium]